jgi:hypothetical protein
MALHLVGFTMARVALHRSARRSYKLLREGANPRSLVSGGVWRCEVRFRLRWTLSIVT